MLRRQRQAPCRGITPAQKHLQWMLRARGTTTTRRLNASEGGLSMVEILTGGIGGNGCIARATGRQDVCTTILPPGALAGKQAFRKHFVGCNQTSDPFSSCSNLEYTLVQIRGKFLPRHKAPILLRLLPYINFAKTLFDLPNVLYLRNQRSYNCRAGAATTVLFQV